MSRHVFISYASQDRAFVGELDKHLRPLVTDGSITLWYDKHLLPGDDFHQLITEELNRADIILLLISSDYLASPFAYPKEMSLALARHARGEVVVIPVILRACAWTASPLATFNVLPTDQIAVELWSSRDAAYLDIVDGLRRRLSRMRGPAAQPEAIAATTGAAANGPANSPASPSDGGTVPTPRRRLRRVSVAILLGVASLVAIGVAVGLGMRGAWVVEVPPTAREQVARHGQPSEQAVGTPSGSALSRPQGQVGSPPATTTPAVADPTTVQAPDADKPAPRQRPQQPTSSTSAGQDNATAATAESGASNEDVATPDGVQVYAEVRLADLAGQPWDSGRGLDRLPDLILCFRRSAGAKEDCKPTLVDAWDSSRVMAHDDASHLADRYRSLGSWSAEFEVVLKDQQAVSTPQLGRGRCRIGLPCQLRVGGKGPVVAEVLVLPSAESTDALTARYLSRCVERDSVLLAQAQALRAAAGLPPVDVATMSYRAMAQTLAAAQPIELTPDMIEQIFAGRGSFAGLPLEQLFRGSVLERAARLLRENDSGLFAPDEARLLIQRLRAALARAPAIDACS
ncbi:MAG: hypothetical protein BGP24_11080 [Lysobacterales bacterium 69-70]|nr:TIR domain-containing protein [Xanthomonadaceae bacterium]ODU30772.1 MAG: hypothetical protein ABS97_20850 [Xanthomonadaceae bacterium SCN 69-320]ODV22099.1 MAG: hypothetical protein ABT27_02225 [Xanthomonadaceae bacterium SCN 69-25]OJY98360.1 MAG: hypothetical protein BGP24_11080 [Xanthomonadales bacterium 69-70]